MYIAICFTKEEKNRINDGKYTSDFRTYPCYISYIFGFEVHNSYK